MGAALSASDDDGMIRLPVLIATLAIVASACGSAATPEPTPTPTGTPSATPTPSASAAPMTLDHDVVYFARDRLPPVARHVDGAGKGATAEARILARVQALFSAPAPAGLFNTTLSAKARPTSVSIGGDTATVDFTVPGGDWGTAGSSGTRSFIQQLIYTASEEPGIRRVLLLENGGQAVIGGEGVVIDHAAARDDVLGYSFKASTDAMTLNAEGASSLPVSAALSLEDDTRGLTRLTVTAAGATPKDVLGFTARVVANDETATPQLGKWVLVVDVANVTTTDATGLSIIDKTPVRAMRTTAQPTGIRYEIGLDDLRPWRAAMQYQPLQLVVDMGGDPQATSPNIALYAPAFGSSVQTGYRISGLVRAFEANYQYRIRDARGDVVVESFGTASLGTSELWGTFSLPLPAVPAGNATIEIFLRSPMDGSISESISTSVQVTP